MELAPSWAAQAKADAVRLLYRAESVLSFQIASAVQAALYKFMSPSEQLGTLMLVCVGLEGAARAWNVSDVRVDMVRSVLVVQVGQALQELLVFKSWASSSIEGVAQGFLLNTQGLCVPAILEMMIPELRQSAYVQNAVSVWLMQYASTTREALSRVDFGVSPVFLCLLALLTAKHTLSLFSFCNQIRFYKYVARAWNMLLVDWLLRTLANNTLSLEHTSQLALWAVVVIVVDFAGDHQGPIQDVRGFTVFRVAAELQRIGLLSSDKASSVGSALLVFFLHSGLGMLQLHSRIAASFAEVLFVAGTNVILQSTASSADTIQLTLVCMVCVVAYQLQAALRLG